MCTSSCVYKNKNVNVNVKFEHLCFLLTFPLLLQVFCKKRRVTRKTMFDGGEGEQEHEVHKYINTHCCRVRRAAEWRNGSVKT